MSERIFIGGNRFSPDDQDASLDDIRYTGVQPKRRLHPRLIVRKFRQVSGGMALTPIVEFHNFILEEMDEPVEEKFFICQTFGPDFAFLYGPRPRIFSYSGRLYNCADKPWKNDWQRAWDRRPDQLVQAGFPNSNDLSSNADGQRGVLSGTNVLLVGGITRLEYDGWTGSLDSTGLIQPAFSYGNEEGRASAVIVREGYLIRLQIRLHAMSPNGCPFGFSMIVTNTMHY